MAKDDLLNRFCRTFDRRSFLKACGVMGLGAAGGAVVQALFEVVKIDRGLVRVARTHLAMGTFITITAVNESRDRAQEAIGRAYEEIDRLIAILSRHDSTTAVSVLNDRGLLLDPPAELLEVVRRSLDFHRLSRGAFDVTIKPLVDLLETVRGGAAAPSREKIQATLESVGSQMIEVDGGRLRFARPAMGITLDGIAKGYIVDRASATLAAHGIDNHLINAGGDIRARGCRSQTRAWSVAVQDPHKRGDYPDVIRLRNGAVATSGSYEVFFDRERVYHHIIDPRTGSSPGHSVSVSVVAESAMGADALSTAVFVMGPQQGVGLIDHLRHSECLLLRENGERFASEGWGNMRGTTC
ncbi:MAG: FAD:protein FMN transferase [Candidatus Krumholzibacteria bacterium]|nr:FAD:protein FMN transferase [Candidatus Krumholzibacteria bacterium]